MSIRKPIEYCSISGVNSAGKLYCTCKVYKESLPLRTITSMINTPTYKAAKFIDTMIKPYIQKTDCVENNLQKKMNQYKHNEYDYSKSFDVVSFFSNVPLNETIKTIVNKLPESEIPKRNIKNLLKSVTGGVFQHTGKLYTQIDGASMGNPLTPTLANFFMGTLENIFFNEDNENNLLLSI